MNQTKVAWIFGPSGSGKTTLISRLTESTQAKDLIELLELAEPLVASNESLKGDGRSSDDVKKEVIKLATNSRTVLIKFQWPDMENRSLPKELRDTIPTASHKIIVLCVEDEETVRRLGNDLRPNRRVSSVENASKHRNRATQYINELRKDGFEVLLLDTNKGYRLVDLGIDG